MRIVITGGTGVLGSALARFCVEKGWNVRVLTRNPGLAEPKWLNSVKYLSVEPSVVRQELSVRPAELLVHLACSYGRNNESFSDLIESNVLWPIKLAEAVAGLVNRWINIGTALPPDASPYALSKHQFSDWLRQPSLLGKLRPTLVELEYFYGPNDGDERFITSIVKKCLSGADVPLTHGWQRRDFVHIDDVVKAIGVIMENELTPGSYVPVGTGEAVPVRYLAEVINGETGKKGNLQFGAVPIRQNEPDECKANIETLKSLGWVPYWSLVDGIKDLVQRERKKLAK